MNSDRTERFEVMVDGKRSGAADKWRHVALSIDSQWDAGSDSEKFLVLAAIRKTYNPEGKTDIRGNEQQTPEQIGRCEGFRELEYRHAATPSVPIVIVPPLMRYLRLVPQPRFEEADLSLRAARSS